MTKTKILFDIHEGRHGYAGIATDLRTTFYALSGSEKVNLTGLIYPSTDIGTETFFQKRTMKQSDIPLVASQVLHQALGMPLKVGPYLRIESEISKKRLLYAGKVLKGMRYFVNSIRRFPVYPVQEDAYFEVVWKKFFSPSLTANAMYSMGNSRFAISTLSEDGSWSSLSRYSRPYVLDTSSHDVVITPNVSTIRFTSPRISRVHDLIPLVRPDVVPFEHIGKFKKMLETTIDNAQVLACVSESAAADLVRYYPESEPKIHVIPCMTTENYYPDRNPDRLLSIIQSRASEFYKNEVKLARKSMEHSLGETPSLIKSTDRYFLFHGTIEPKKNVDYLLTAMSQFVDTATPGFQRKLIVSGKFGWMFKETQSLMKQLIARDVLIHVEDLTIAELRVVLSHADAFIFPSLYEGFGLPPVEAMQSGCPVIVAHGSSLPETVGQAGLYCDPYDPDTLVQAMMRITQDRPLRRELRAEGVRQLSNFSKEAVLPKWERAIEAALRAGKR